ncbi:MAG: type II toxin-antitoxin system RelE/ParE family toxin [Flavobacteriales bacterium]|nr:type II toxin-antitoxin system RelE/ParE family toxin [Flavobacteriales bacterium]
MSYSFHVRVEAVREFSAVAIWYDKQRKGLGHRFLDELQRCFTFIRSNPYGYQLRKGDFRHAALDDFPYRVVFKVKGNQVFVYQVRHTNRKPSKRFGP